MNFKLYCFLFTGLLIFNETIQHDEIKCFHGKRDFFIPKENLRQSVHSCVIVSACVCEARKDRNNIRLNGRIESRRLVANGPVLI